MSNRFTLLSPPRIFPAYGVSLVLSWMSFSSGRFTRDLCMDTNPSLILSWMPFSSGRFARGLCMDTSLKRLRIFFSQVPFFVWGLVFKNNYKSIFLQQVGWERCLVVFNGTLKSGDLPRLKRRLGVCAGIGFEPRHGRLHDQASRRFLPPFFFEFFCFSFLLLRWAMFDISLLRPLPGSDEVSGYVV